MASFQHARNLVCSFCWQNFFNTEQFQRFCLCRCRGSLYSNRVDCEMTVRQINEPASNGCSWCSYIRTFTSGRKETRDPDNVLSIFLNDFYCPYSSPSGKNTYYLRMDWETQECDTFYPFRQSCCSLCYSARTSNRGVFRRIKTSNSRLAC
jgi:hypothetical protein